MAQQVKLLSEIGFQHFKTNMELNQFPYINGDHMYFEQELQKPGILVNSNITTDLSPLRERENGHQYIDDVKAVFGALKHLTPAQASHERLWVSLALTEPYRKYMFQQLSESRTPENRVFSSFYFTNSPRRSLFLHLLARLWWVGYLTYDEQNKENPYWLTEYFCKTDFAARCIIFFSSNFTATRKMTRGIIRGLLTAEKTKLAYPVEGMDGKLEEILNPNMLAIVQEEEDEDENSNSLTSIKRAHIVHVLQQFNILGGMILLDMYSEEETYNLTIKWMEVYMEHMALT